MPSRSLRAGPSWDALLDIAAAGLRAFAREGETLVIAATRGAADELARAAAGPALAGVHRFTLAQLAAMLAAGPMAERGLAPVSELGIQALAARTIHLLHRDRKLKYFHPVADMPGFAVALAATLKELRLEGVQARDLAATGLPGFDLAALQGVYEREIEERGVADLASLLDLAAQVAAAGEHPFAGLPVVLLDPRAETAAHRSLLEAIVRQAPAVTAFALDRDRAGLETLANLLGCATEVTAPEAGRNTLARIRAGLFAPERAANGAPDGSFDFFSAPGEGLECVEIARRIRALDAPFDELAILLRDPDRYQPAVEEALRRAGIPAYFSRGTRRPDPAGRAFLALLACAAEGCSATRFAEYLSLGQTPIPGAGGSPEAVAAPFSPADDEVLGTLAPSPEDGGGEDPDEPSLNAPFGWERLLVDASVIGGRDRWRRRLRGLDAELRLQFSNPATDEERREQIARQLHRLERLERFALPAIDALAALPASANWGEWIERLSELAAMTLRVPGSVIGVLSELLPMAESGPAGLSEVVQVLSARLRFLRREPPARRYGRVFVGSIEEARGRSFRVVFLPGVAEGIFPRRPGEDPLLLDAYRSRLENALIRREDRAARERLLLHIAAAAARERFVISYPRLDAGSARARVPSFYAMEAVTAAEGALPDLGAFGRRAAESSQGRLGWPAPSDPAQAIDDTEYDLAELGRVSPGSARYLLEVNRHLGRSLRARWTRWTRGKWGPSDGMLAPSSALDAHRLEKRAYSPTALQHYAICPYRFLLAAIHRFRKREERAPVEQLDPLTRGSLFHAVQFEFYRATAGGAMPESALAVLDLLDEVLERVASRYEEELAPAIPRVWQSEIEDLRRDLRGWLQHTDRNWKAEHFEFAFGHEPRGDHDAASVREEALIAGKYRIRGSIDVIEEHAATKRLRVTDHKTGRAPAEAPACLGGGQTLQPVLYGLAAEQLLARPVDSGRLFFATERGGYTECEIPLNEPNRANVEWALCTIDTAIEKPFLPAAPVKGACDRCDFRAACGPYEEIRVALKPKDGLRALEYLRGLK